jgi:hypothetical protein
MAYFDGFTANLFREGPDGQRVFAPFGSLDHVYLVPSDADAARITSTVQRMYRLMLGGILAVQVALGWRWNLTIGPLVLGGFYYGMHALSRDLPRTDLTVRDLVPIPRAEIQARMGRAIGRRWLVAMLTGSLVFVAAGVAMWLQSREASALLPAGFFAMCSAVFAYQLWSADRGRACGDR